MKLRRNSCRPVGLLVLFWLIISPGTFAQEHTNLDSIFKRYPDNSVVLGAKSLDVIIELVDGKPVMTFDNYSEYIAISDDARLFADSKEYFSNKFVMKNLEAYSLCSDNNRIKKIPVKTFLKTTESRGNLFYDDQYAYRFTFPSVSKGTRMITKSKAISEDPIFPIRFYFGNYLPSENMTVSVTCPNDIFINYKLFGKDTDIIRFNLIEKAGKKIYTWHVVRNKCYVRDNVAPDLDYFMPHVIIQIARYTYKGVQTDVMGSLQDLYRWNYSKISGVNLILSPKIMALTDSIIDTHWTEQQKVRKIFAWVQKNIKYIAIEDGENGYVPREADLVLKRRYGDCKDKTSLLVAMLKSQNIPASFVWVGTIDIPYRKSEFASPFSDNHMVAAWWQDDKTPVILDGTTRYNSLEEVPSFIQGKQCLIDQGKDDYFLYTIPLASPERNSTYDSLAVELKGDTIVGNGFTTFKGEKKAEMMAYLDGKDSADFPKIVSNQMPKASNKFIIQSVSCSNLTENDQPFSIHYKFYLPDYVTSSNNIFYMNLNLDRFPTGFNIQEDRWMPLASGYTHKHTFICNMKIPKGYELKEIPEDSHFNHPYFSYNQSYTACDSSITVKTVVYGKFQVIDDENVVQFRKMLELLHRNYLKSIPIQKIN